VNQEADYVVVGGGSAGCLIAGKLAEDPNVRVDLIEAGERDVNPWFHIPAGFAKLLGSGKHFWHYETEPEGELLGRTIKWPRGKVLGGSGSINGMVFLRGAPVDFDGWEEDGAHGWSWKDVVPYFARFENWEGPSGYTRGKGGPINVTQKQTLSQGAGAFVDSCKELGFPIHRDVNDGELEGVSGVQLNVRKGRRISSATAYLRHGGRRPNLRVVTNALTTRIVIEEKRAKGVVVKRVGSNEEQVYRARKEVILCAGAISSPHLLAVSGIGDGHELSRFGIKPVVHSPGVGRNMQDHLLIRFRFRTRPMGTLNEVTNSRLRLGMTALNYAIRREGPLANGPTEAVLFARSQEHLREADIQVQYINFCISEKPGYQLPAYPGFMLNYNQCRPESKGYLKLASADVRVPPKIFANYLSTELDRKVALDGAKLCRRIARTGPLADLLLEELAPPDSVTGDEELMTYIRSIGSTVYHPCGTCRIGDDEFSVVDSNLKVHGVEGLRVADASVMPRVPSTNIQAAVLMIAERAVDLITGKAQIAMSGEPARSRVTAAL
jgi:choline dehydrogenase